MELIWGLAAIGIYLTIIGVLFQDVMNQIRSRHDEYRILKRRNKRGKHRKI